MIVRIWLDDTDHMVWLQRFDWLVLIVLSLFQEEVEEPEEEEAKEEEAAKKDEL